MEQRPYMKDPILLRSKGCQCGAAAIITSASDRLVLHAFRLSQITSGFAQYSYGVVRRPPKLSEEMRSSIYVVPILRNGRAVAFPSGLPNKCDTSVPKSMIVTNSKQMPSNNMLMSLR